MKNSFLIIGLVAAAAGAGCTEQGKTAANTPKKQVYHDKRVGLGTNIPRTYADADAAKADDQHQSQLDQEQFDKFRGSTGAAGTASGTH